MQSIEHYVAVFAQIKERLDYLKNVVIPIEQCAPISQESERSFYKFLDTVNFTRRPYIYLLDNGTLRAVWMNVNGDKLNVTFAGDDKLTLYLSIPSNHVKYFTTGFDTLSNIKERLSYYDLTGLLTE
jgi:hypothetical protein